jgi:hypothetical protein
MHRLRIADQMARAGQFHEALAQLKPMRDDHPESLLIHQRMAEVFRGLHDPLGEQQALAQVARIRAARQGEMASRMPGYWVVDPIFRGSRLYYSAMLVEALTPVAGSAVRLLTRVDTESDLLDSYRDRLALAHMVPVLKVPAATWYGQIDRSVCRQIVEQLAAAPLGTQVYLAGWNELMPGLFEEAAALGKPLPVHLVGYEYHAGSLSDSTKRAQLTGLAQRSLSLTVWVLDESLSPQALKLPGVRVKVMPDPVPHAEASGTLKQARQRRSTFVTDHVPEGHLSLLAVGLQSSRKGLRDLIKAARLIQAERLPVRILLSGKVVAGEEELTPQVAALAPVMKARNDYVSDAEILATYNACDAVLLPYARDFSGSSGVFAHAMAFAKPVIATEHGCVGWRTRELGLGLTYAAGDAEALTGLVRQMLAWTPEQWVACRERCQGYYASHSYDASLRDIRSEAAELSQLDQQVSRAALALVRSDRSEGGSNRAVAGAVAHSEDSYSFSLQAIESIRQICLLDTGIGSRNMGDHIIVDSIKQRLREAFPNAIFVTVPTHEYLGPESLKLLDSSEIRLVCGTNLLASHMDEYKQWKIGGLEFSALRDLTLLGCGWWQYQEAPNAYTELLLNRILSSKTLHSVRDSYSAQKLMGLQGKTVINTTCPTLWGLTPTHLQQIPTRMARDVVTTLTDYKADPVADLHLLNHLESRYRHVYVWIQGTGDFSYLKRLASQLSDRVRVVPPTLDAYDDLLTSSLDLDYVGTRLHAGARALQKKRRSLILAVDNRAREISADTGLPCLPRERAVAELEALIEAFSPRSIHLPVAHIQRWLNQFR